MNTKEVLLQCADHLEAHGWNQGGYIRPGTRELCALQVIDEVAPNTTTGGRYYRDARNALEDHLGISRYGLVEWNDDPERTKEEVVAAFRAAAEAVAE